jgi:dTDP-4-dehydrorhamnose 3,5-epimerase
MKFTPTKIHGVFTIDLERRGDERGWFARLFCEQEFANNHLETRFVQINNSTSAFRGTLRGMHYQLPQSAEVKVVRCLRGALYDVVLDLRPDSPTFGKYFGTELTSENRRMMYVPRGCAHGFLTLEDDTEAFYLVSATYDPKAERGVRFNDSRFTIHWPIAPSVISDKDRQWPDYNDDFHGTKLMKDLL